MKRIIKYILATSLVFPTLLGVATIEPTHTQAATAQVKKPLTYLGVKVNADSPLEQKLALAMLKAESQITLTEFKEIKDFDYLMDRVQKVTYQNPLILGTTDYTYSYSAKTKVVTIRYTNSKTTILKKQKEIMSVATKALPTIIKKGMNEQQKHKAIYDYLEKLAIYDDVAADLYTGIGATTDKISTKYSDSFTSYGVLVKKKGVCSSYAHAYKLLSDLSGLNTIVVTGTLDGGAHAWNKIKLNNQWTNVDATNNMKNSNVPYLLFQANDAQAKQQQYIQDKLYALDSDVVKYASNGKSNDYYVQNGLQVRTLDELSQKLQIAFDNKVPLVSFRLPTTITYEMAYDAISEIYGYLQPEEIEKVKIYSMHNYIVITR